MITELQYVELTNRLKELEIFRQKAIIVFYVVTVLGTFLKGLGWYGNTLINKI